MKTRILSSLIFLAFATAAIAGPGKLDNEIKDLQKKIDSGLASGALTKPDADELNQEISDVQSVQSNEPSLTRATRRDLHEKLSKIQKDLDRKEAQAKALSAPTPAP